MRLVVIGGSDAGIGAALRACELSHAVEATLVVAADYPNFSICGLPFYVSCETPDWHQLAHRTRDELEPIGMRLLLNHTAIGVDPSRHEVCIQNSEGQTSALGYDKLVIATGAGPIRPAMPGVDRQHVHVLHTMADGFLVHDLVASGGIQEATIVGSGYIAVEGGIEPGEKGAVRVDRSMRTNVADVYAAGDCVETWHGVLQSATYLPVGTTARKQGRVAGENAAGGQRLFQGSLGTQLVKVFDIAVARTGLRDHEARHAGFDPLTLETQIWDHKAYYPGAQQLSIRVTGHRRSGQLLGAQLLGHWQAEVAKHVDVYAGALSAGQSVDENSDLDLSYTPPLGSPRDAGLLAARAWTVANGGLS